MNSPPYMGKYLASNYMSTVRGISALPMAYSWNNLFCSRYKASKALPWRCDVKISFLNSIKHDKHKRRFNASQLSLILSLLTRQFTPLIFHIIELKLYIVIIVDKVAAYLTFSSTNSKTCANHTEWQQKQQNKDHSAS